MHRYAPLAVVALFGVGACYGRTSITVQNGSGVEVQDVRVEGRCFAEKIGTLPPGDARSVRVKPCGESGIRTMFTADGTARRTPELGYVEASALPSIQQRWSSDRILRCGVPVVELPLQLTKACQLSVEVQRAGAARLMR
jgi:hypothetical protein